MIDIRDDIKLAGKMMVATLVALALSLTLMGTAGAVDNGDQLVVDGVKYSPTKITGGATHYNTPDVDPQVAYTERNTWVGNGSEHLPCEGGIHWIDNANVLTVSHCLETPPTTTTTVVETCPIADAIDAGWTPGGDVPCGHGTTTVPETTTVPVTTTTIVVETSSTSITQVPPPSTQVPPPSTTVPPEPPTLAVTGAGTWTAVLAGVAMLIVGSAALWVAGRSEDLG